MAKYEYKVKGVDYVVEIQDIEGNIANVTVNGIPFEVEMKQPVKAGKQKVKLSEERRVKSEEFNSSSAPQSAKASADLQSAASKKAFIRLKAYANAQESIIIDVSNNAGLIPEDVASHIFIPFFTTKPEGSGIGLSLSRQIMRVSGGSLSLHQDKAQGITTFRIIIP